jgi:fatty-acyl-CoA synthase
MTERDRYLVIVPMFHANAWGTPYGAFLGGSDLVMPQMLLQGEHLARIIAEFRPTLSCGVPTIWNDLLRVANTDPSIDLSSLRRATSPPAARRCPRRSSRRSGPASASRSYRAGA